MIGSVRSSVGLLGAALFACASVASQAADGRSTSEEPVAIGSRRELFVNDYLIASLVAPARIELHHPQLADRVENGQPANPWGNVFREGERFKMLVRGFKDPQISWKSHALDVFYANHLLLYYESGDGIHWKAPDLGLYSIPGHPAGNVVLADQLGVEQTFAAFQDARPGIPESERYKGLGGKHFPQRVREEYLAKYGPDGLRAYASPDAIHWSAMQASSVIPGDWGMFDSQNIAFWSEHEQCYVCYFRVFDNHHAPGLRSIRRTTSNDFLNWSEPVDVRINRPGEELYTSNIEPYFRAPHLYVGLPTRFMKKRGASTDILFVSSRDGLSFNRAVNEAFIRPGLDKKAWGDRSNYAAYHIMPTRPDEISIYVSGGRRYTLRTDGFASINAPDDVGEMLTKPLVFSGSELEINYSTSAAGRVRVEIQDASGKPLPEYTLDDCPQIVGDQIERVVAWNNGADLSRLAGRPVRLRFVLQDADLYALRFR